MSHQTTYHDRYGLPLSTGSAVATDHYIQGVDLILSGNLGAEEHLRAAVAADAGFALAQAALATIEVRSGRPDDARARLALVEERTRGATRRERQHVAVLAETALGSPARALDLTDEHLGDFPRDAFILRQYTFLRLGGGCRDLKAAILDTVERLAPAYGDDWYYTGTRSFYLHELNRLAESRHYAEQSLAGNPRNGNAAHSLAHCFYETSDYSGGQDFLDSWLTGYHPDAPNYCHLNWHRALFELAQGRYRRSFEIYQESIRPSVVRCENGTMGPPIGDAASLFWRYRLYGSPIERTDDWREIEAFAERVAAGPVEPFNDTHCAMAFAATGNDRAMESLIVRLRTAASEGNTVVAVIGLPLVLGIAAFGHGDYEETVRQIEPVTEEISRIPGSRAQRRVFEETLLRAYMLTGRHAQAERLLRRRLEHRHSGRDYFWLAEEGAERGDQRDAQANFAHGRLQWQDADPDAPEFRQASQSDAE